MARRRAGAQPDPRAHPSGPRCRATRSPHRRPSAEPTDDDIEAAKAMLANPDIGVTQIAHRLGVSPATLYRNVTSPPREARIPQAFERGRSTPKTGRPRMVSHPGRGRRQCANSGLLPKGADPTLARNWH
jgi:hypothetical protein